VEWEVGGARLDDGGGERDVGGELQRLGSVTGLHTRFEYGYDGRGNAEYLRARLGEDSQLGIVKYGIEDSKLQSFKQLDLTRLSDAEQEAFQDRFSHYGTAEPHGLDYIQSGIGKGVDRYFSPDAFGQMQEIQ